MDAFAMGGILSCCLGLPGSGLNLLCHVAARNQASYCRVANERAPRTCRDHPATGSRMSAPGRCAKAECPMRSHRVIPEPLPKPALYCQPCQVCKNANTRQGGKYCQPLEKRVKLHIPPAFWPGHFSPENRVKMRHHSHQSGKLPDWRRALHRVSASEFAAYQGCIFPQPRL